MAVNSILAHGMHCSDWAAAHQRRPLPRRSAPLGGRDGSTPEYAVRRHSPPWRLSAHAACKPASLGPQAPPPSYPAKRFDRLTLDGDCRRPVAAASTHTCCLSWRIKAPAGFASTGWPQRRGTPFFPWLAPFLARQEKRAPPSFASLRPSGCGAGRHRRADHHRDAIVRT